MCLHREVRWEVQRKNSELRLGGGKGGSYRDIWGRMLQVEAVASVPGGGGMTE